MIIDGKKLAERIKTELRSKLETEGLKLRLDVVLVGDNVASEKYVERKRKVGEEIGVEVVVHELTEDIKQGDLEEEIKRLVNNERVNGVIVQLPLPPHINEREILDLVPAEKDVDALSREARVLSPIVGAIREILQSNNIDLENKKIVVVGQGKLVGQPAALWLTQEGYDVSVIDVKTKNADELLLSADVIISGAGRPGLITSNKIRDGVVIIDAATSESNGQLMGDADPRCASKCLLFTPVPGGVGPLTVVMLFKNLFSLSRLNLK